MADDRYDYAGPLYDVLPLPAPPAPGTEPSDEAALTMSIHEAIYGESCASDHPATFYIGANAAIHAVLASAWLAADRQRVAREAVEAALEVVHYALGLRLHGENDTETWLAWDRQATALLHDHRQRERAGQ